MPIFLFENLGWKWHFFSPMLVFSILPISAWWRMASIYGVLLQLFQKLDPLNNLLFRHLYFFIILFRNQWYLRCTFPACLDWFFGPFKMFLLYFVLIVFEIANQGFLKSDSVHYLEIIEPILVWLSERLLRIGILFIRLVECWNPTACSPWSIAFYLV